MRTRHTVTPAGVILSDVNRAAAFGALLLLALGTACGATTPAPAPLKTIHIGVDLPVTGSEARAAVPALNGVRFFVQTHPTLDGFGVALTVADDAGGGGPNPTRGASNVRDFVADSSVLAMIGPFDAGVARKEIPIANEAGLAMVSPATSNPCLTRDVFMPAKLNPARTVIDCKMAGLPLASDLRPGHANNFFRLSTTDELQGAAAADYVLTTLHLLRVGVISDHEAYGQGLVDAFSARLTNLGGTVLGHLDLDPKNPDATAFLQRMKDEGAQAIYYGGPSKMGGCAIRAQMKAQFTPGEATPFLGGDGIAQDPACVRLAGDNGAGVFATVPIIDAVSRPGAQALIRDFKAAFGNTSDFGPYTLVAYDATALVYAALDRAIRDARGELPERAKVTQGVAQVSGLAGVTGNLGFDKSGDTTNRVISIFESVGSDPRMPWKLAGTVDYSAHLPY
jgi:branched-chain amino acid transport system substrate-binding protein